MGKGHMSEPSRVLEKSHILVSEVIIQLYLCKHSRIKCPNYILYILTKKKKFKTRQFQLSLYSNSNQSLQKQSFKKITKTLNIKNNGVFFFQTLDNISGEDMRGLRHTILCLHTLFPLNTVGQPAGKQTGRHFSHTLPSLLSLGL